MYRRSFVTSSSVRSRIFVSAIEAERGSDLARRRLADPVDVRQPDLEPLLVRKVHSGDSCQVATPAFACVEGSCR